MTHFIEIALCIAGYYAINRFLLHQENKTIALGWYAYHALMMFSYVAPLETIFFLSATLFPVILTLCVVLHEQRIQKMFVVAQRLDPLTTLPNTSLWIDELIKFALVRLNANKDLRIVIEKNDHLDALISAPELLSATVSKNTLELLYDAFETPKNSFLLTESNGTIRALAAHWRTISFENSTEITAATDCIVVKAEAITRRFTIYHGSRILENLSAHHALNLLHELSHSPSAAKGAHVQKNHTQSYHHTTLSS